MKAGDIVRHVNGTNLAMVRLDPNINDLERNVDLYLNGAGSTAIAENKLVVVQKLRVAIGTTVVLTKDVSPFCKGTKLSIKRCIAYKKFYVEDPRTMVITGVTDEDIVTSDGKSMYDEETKIGESMTPVKPETASQQKACTEAIQDAVAAKLAEDKKVFTAQMAEYIKVETDRRKLDARAKELEEALGITDEIKATLF